MARVLQVRRVNQKWDEAEAKAADGGLKISSCLVSYVLDGDIQGNSSLVYAMTYLPNGVAVFSGYELVTGRVLGKDATFVLSHHGVFSSEQATISVAILPGSASGSLAGASGEGSIVASMADPAASSLTLQVTTQV